MTVRIDLDDLPPKLAAALTGADPGEDVLLVQHGVVVGRLTAAEAGPEPEPPASPGQHQAEVFENFRAAIEDEF
ncbi:hypothetical protein [Phenylobacterium sp. J367]|uniref:hypothetical protein n=1 Tax=Phenylobacterium sp. J367 TaxID=2898435 RepID=UPI0021508C36|nr:hypothetical protein [Phenylobacterium sp. J367]MCR5877493.1 hypothetical protein [Phenylobacterium sp. J367]